MYCLNVNMLDLVRTNIVRNVDMLFLNDIFFVVWEQLLRLHGNVDRKH
jgi:hypothetical protein